MFFITILFLAFNIQASVKCHLDIKGIDEMSFEEIQNYSVKIKKNNCIEVALKEVDRHVSAHPKTNILKFSLLTLKCGDKCSEESNIQSLQLLKKACLADISDACFTVEMGERIDKNDYSFDFAYKYCEKKGALACSMIGHDLEKKGDPHFKKYFEKGCLLKSIIGCEYLKTLKAENSVNGK